MRSRQILVRRPARNRRGRGALALPFFLFGTALFGAPFLRAPDATEQVVYTGEEEDWTRFDPSRNPDTDRPFAIDVRDFDAEFAGELDATLRELVEREVEARYAMGSDALVDTGLIEARRLPSGASMYDAECAGCHGSEGDGGGPAARYLHPRPRNFWKGKFKFTSTETGKRPTRQDLNGIITRGLAGSAMPSFALLNDEQLWDLVEYVRWLALRGEFRQTMLDVAWDDEEHPDPAEIAEIIESRWRPENTVATFPSIAEPPNDAASIERGRVLFLDGTRATCFTCHGETGRGDGPTADQYQDDWGYPIRPRDFSLGVFRAGTEAKDLYISIATGIGGTPMGAFSGVLEPLEIWDLVHFVQSLAAPRK